MMFKDRGSVPSNPSRSLLTPTDAYQWYPLLLSDLDAVNTIANAAHPGLPERPEVFAEKISLFPAGCRKLLLGSEIVGYGLSHPWMLYSIPPLDEFLRTLPQEPQCIYIHDVVVIPRARGHGAARCYVDLTKALARSIGIASLALVSVYGTDVLWSRLGFRVINGSDVNAKLGSYGTTAKYMIMELDD